MTSLFEIVDQYINNLSALADMEISEDVISDTIEGMQGDIEIKLRAIVAYALQLQSDADARMDQSRRMSEGAKSLSAKSKSLLEYAKSGIQRSGIKLPMNLPEFTLNIAKNPPKLSDEIDIESVPNKYLRRSISFNLPEDADSDCSIHAIREAYDSAAKLSIEVDRKALLDALKSNNQAITYAKISDPSYRLTVK